VLKELTNCFFRLLYCWRLLIDGLDEAQQHMKIFTNFIACYSHKMFIIIKVTEVENRDQISEFSPL